MKFLVCVKQVPIPDQVRFQPGINRIIREGVAAAVNPLDLAALGHAVTMRGDGDEIVAVTMGPPAARAALEEALRRGADRAIHLVDMRFAGADTLATARALAAVVAREQPAVVLLGRSTMDGATAQVGPQLAELAGLAQVTHAVAISCSTGTLHVAQETERGTEHWRCPLPALVSVEDGNAPLVVSDAAGAIEELDADALGGDSAGYGIRGSATYVQKVIDLPPRRTPERVSGPAELAGRIWALAAPGSTRRVLPATTNGGRPGAGSAGAGDGAREIWVLAEEYAGSLHPVTAEGIAAASAVAPRLGAEVVAVLLTGEPGRLPDELAATGADRVMVARHDLLNDYRPERHTAALAALVAQRSPFAVIGPWTVRGRDFLPRVAARLALGMTGDVVGLELDTNPGDPSILDLVWLKPAWAGTALARVIARTVPSLGTLRPGAVPALPTRPGRRVAMEMVTADVDAPGGADQTRLHPDRVAGLLDAATVVLVLGTGLRHADIASAVQVAEEQGWCAGGTRDLIATGALPAALEVSLRKRSLSPTLVIGLGLADPGELDAVRGARAVVTVDPDPDAPVHHCADIAAVLDAPSALAALRAGAATGAQGAEPASPGAGRG